MERGVRSRRGRMFLQSLRRSNPLHRIHLLYPCIASLHDTIIPDSLAFFYHILVSRRIMHRRVSVPYALYQYHSPHPRVFPCSFSHCCVKLGGGAWDGRRRCKGSYLR